MDRRRGHRRLAAAAVLTAVLTACAGNGPATKALRALTPPPSPSPVPVAADASPDTVVRGASVSAAQVDVLFDRRAAAVKAKDLAAYLATVDQSDPELVAQQRTEFTNLIHLPFVSWNVLAAKVSPPTPAGSGHWFPGGGTYREIVKWSPDAESTSHVWGFRVAVSGDHLVLTSDADAQPWALTPLVFHNAGGSVIVVDAKAAAQVPVVTRTIASAIRYDLAVWDKSWPHNFVIFATASDDLFDRQWFGGNRIGDYVGYVFHDDPAGDEPRMVLNLGRGEAGSEMFERILRHELTHAAAAHDTQDGTATWVTEGFADYVAYHDLGGDVRGSTGTLPVGSDDTSPNPFYAGDVGSHYTTALSAFLFIDSRVGTSGALKFFLAAQGHADSMGTAYATLGLTPSSFLAAWHAWQADYF